MNDRRQGITMLELVISVFILGLALLPVFELLTRGAHHERVSRDETLAVAMGSELLDQIQCMPYADLQVTSDLPIGNADHGSNLVQNRDSTVLMITPVHEQFTRTLTIEDLSDYLRKITVKVTWRSEAEHTVHLTTFMEYAP